MEARTRRAERAINDLDGVLDKLEACSAGVGKVSIGEIHEAIGQRAYGPLLLVPALAATTPIGLIPLAPTILALCILIVGVQIALGRERLWLPRQLERLGVSKTRLRKGVKAARPVARLADRIVRPRLSWLTVKPCVQLVGLVVAALAIAIPPLELVPFAVFLPAAGVFSVGLGLTARDGIATIVALMLSAATAGVAGWALLGR